MEQFTIVLLRVGSYQFIRANSKSLSLYQLKNYALYLFALIKAFRQLLAANNPANYSLKTASAMVKLRMLSHILGAFTANAQSNDVLVVQLANELPDTHHYLAILCGGNLVSIRNAQENDAVVSLLLTTMQTISVLTLSCGWEVSPHKILIHGSGLTDRAFLVSPIGRVTFGVALAEVTNPRPLVL